MNQTWLKYLPRKIRQHVEGRYELQKIIANTGWLFGDKLMRMGMGLVVGVWLARYLGPNQYGQLNYAIAFVSIFTALSNLGLNSVVVRDLVRQPDSSNTILGSAFVLQLLGGMGSFLCIILAIRVIRPHDSSLQLLVSLLSLTMVFKSTDIVKYWFESKLQSKYRVLVENVAFVALSLVQIMLIVTQARLQSFVWALVAESLIIAVGLLWIYGRSGGRIPSWNFQWQRARTLFIDSWPLMLSGLAIMVYMRIDQIMLGQMLGDKVVGIYSAATRISELWYFMPISIISSVFPTIINSKKQSQVIYYQRLQQLFNFMILMSLIMSIAMTFLSDSLIFLLFGDGYEKAGTVLAIHIWSGPFVFLGLASSNWYLNENLQQLAFVRTILGAFVNIIANIFLIPKYGVIGAAMATVVAQMTAAYFFDLLNTKTRHIFWMKSKSFVSFYRINL